MVSKNKSNNSDYILWLGSIYDELHLLNNQAASPAANAWQKSLIKALQDQGQRVVLFSHHFQRVWPYGPLFVNKKIPKDGFDIEWCNYLNLPILKERSISISIRRKISSFFKSNGFPRAIISYNPTKENTEIGLFFQLNLSIPWIDLCADSNDPGEKWELYTNGAELAMGHIFLSYHAFVTCPFQTKLHLDGGIDQGKIKITECSDKVIFLYSGMLGPWGGVDFLVTSFSKLKNKNVELWICGHGILSPVLKGAIQNDKRIVFFGQVSDSQLHKMSIKANAFINPRPTEINGGSMNFPSKILRYLAYGKPIISTLTPGLSTDYTEILYLLTSDTEEELVKAIEQVISWDETKIGTHRQKVETFILKNRNWPCQALRLLNWLGEEINTKTI